MRSRLFSITAWPALAQEARYQCQNLAGVCLVSERQLQRFFVLRLNQTPKEWLQALRMGRALDLVRCGYSTKAVAAELCYEASSQFCREFKKHYRHAPQSFAPAPPGRVWPMMSDLAQPSPLPSGPGVSQTPAVPTPTDTQKMSAAKISYENTRLLPPRTGAAA